MKSKAINPIRISRTGKFQVMSEREKNGMSGGKLNLFLTCLVSKFMKSHRQSLS